MGNEINVCRNVDLTDCSSILLIRPSFNDKIIAAINKIRGRRTVRFIAERMIDGEIRGLVRQGFFDACLLLTPHGKIVHHNQLRKLLPQAAT